METTVKITWDKPEEQQWLCADNIKIALSQHCKNTKFEVVEISQPKDFKERLNLERINLQDKVEKLESFLQSEKAKEISEFQLTILNIQLSSMFAYLQCLVARIEEL